MANDPRVVEALRQRVAFHLEELAKYWKPGVKLTFLARVPWNAESNVLVTDEEDVQEAIRSITALTAPERAKDSGSDPVKTP